MSDICYEKRMTSDNQCTEQVIIITRYPCPGKVKTRLIPHLSAEEAARMHRRLTEQIISRVRPIIRQRAIRLSIAYTGGSLREMQDWLGSELPLIEQQGANLGRRIAALFRASRSTAAQRTALIGSDCPDVDDRIIATALDRLQTHDLVLGPTMDGGYYLIGLNSSLPPDLQESLFTDIDWGTSEVYQQTLDRADKAGLTTCSLQILHDIDRPRDLEHFNHHPDPE